MVKNLMRQKEWILQPSLMNSKTLCLTKKIMRHKMKRIQSRKHKLGTYEISKISLTCFNDKWYVQDDSTNTLAYFHIEIYSQVTNKNKCA